MHLLTIDDLSKDTVLTLLKKAKYFLKKAVLPQKNLSTHAGQYAALLFFEPSTRTLVSFDIAAKRLGFNTIICPTQSSSLSKGETIEDMMQNLASIGCNTVIMRHSDHVELERAANSGAKLAVINAGSGKDHHPSQALLDLFTMTEKKGAIEQLNIAIVGDLKHSRVAQSQIQLFKKMGAMIHLVAPDSLLPLETEGCQCFNDVSTGIKDCDVVIALRLQKERVAEHVSVDHLTGFQLSQQVLNHAKADCLLMHPGPVIWGEELAVDLQHDPRSVILQQPQYGTAMRMAILDAFAANRLKPLKNTGIF